ncbi:hypothetical protein CBI33_21080 [Rhodococcus erythropolis]|nr:hypothetical protein CBI33_21080 [Rhodococcus erythropolis]
MNPRLSLRSRYPITRFQNHGKRGPHVLVAAFALSALVLSGCSSSATGTAGGTGPADPNAELKVATSHVPASLDPCAGNIGYDIDYLQLMYAPLIDAEPATQKLRPGIASEWGFSGPDNLTFEMTLQNGLTFHDGTTLDAAAVKASMEHCLSLGIVSFPTIKSVEATSPDQIKISLSAPTSGLPGWLNGRLGMIVSPTALTAAGTDFANKPVGAGPYTFTSAVPNSSYTFSRFDDYKPAGPPNPQLAKIQIQVISNPTALTNALTSNAADFAYGLTPSSAPILERNPNLNVSHDPRLGVALVVINNKNPVVNDVRVRLAMQYALDRKAIARAALDSAEGTAAFGQYPPGSQFYDEETEDAWPYDPEKAKSLLAEAGYPNGVTVRGLAGNLPPYSTNAVLVGEQWEKVGIKVDFVEMSGPQAITEFVAHNSADVFSVGWPTRASTPLNFEASLGSRSYFRQNSVPNEELEKLIALLNNTYDETAQLDIVKQINQVVIKSAEYVPLYFTPDVVAYTKNVHGAVPALNGSPNLTYLSKS